MPGSICSKFQLEWWAVERDRKSPPRTARTQEQRAELVFLEREEGGGRRLTWRWGLWAPSALWAQPRGRSRQLAAWATVGPPWSAPGASGSLPAWKFLFNFFWNFSENFTVENFSEF